MQQGAVMGPSEQWSRGRGARRRGRGRVAARLAAAALTLVAGLGAVAGPPGLPGGPSAAYADQARLPGSLSTSAVQRRTVLVPVPDGVVPRRLLGTVRVSTTEPGVPLPEGSGQLQLLVGDRVAETLAARPRAVLRTVVRRSDVDRDGRLPVTLQWVGGCAPPGVTAELTDLRLQHGGAEEAPRTEREFFGDAVSRIDVVVPQSARDDLLEAGLQVVALLARRYDADVPVSMTTADAVLPRVGAGQRVVRLEPGRSPSRGIEQRFGLWTLSLRGPGPDLVEAVRSAADRSGQRAAVAPTGAGQPRRLADLGVPASSLGGWGTSLREVPLPGDLLGGPGVDLDVRLVGSFTALADGTTARLDVRLDGALLGSRDLAEEDDSTLDLTVRVPGERLRPGSDLEVVLTAVPAGGCAEAAATLPVSLELDGSRSTVTPSPGAPDDSPVAGLGRFPAALEGDLSVAVRAERRQHGPAAARAGRLVVALQRLAGLPLEVELVTADDLLADDRPGLLVGATEQDALAVQAPVALVPGGGLDALPRDEPFAALQGVRHRDRDLLLLGSWAPRTASSEPLVDSLLDRVASRGGTAWQGGALVLPATGEPLVTDPAPPSDPTSQPEEPNPYVPYLVAAALVLGALLVAQVVSMVRRERRRRADRGDPARAGTRR